MKQEDKEILLQDLCTRLPYGVKISVSNRIEILEGIGILDNVAEYGSYLSSYIEEVKPYLFPLSSMTEEQKKFFKDRPIFLDFDNDLVVREDFFGNSQFTMLNDWVEVILWLVKNHFDYRGLIPKGLAIDCTVLNVY